jgi:pimeloyl-ACP methyl ester carboxylesterase
MIIRPPVSALRWTTFGSITVERGCSELLLHGNGSISRISNRSGGACCNNYRVVVFDRPGFGTAPGRATSSGPDSQAQLIKRALERRGVSHAIVLGYSGGASVAVALALKFPDVVRGLVLAIPPCALTS